MNRKTFTFFGGVLGLVAFLAVALLPSLVYGGYAGAILASTIVGGPIQGEISSRLLVVFGMLVGLLSVASIFTVIGSAFGAGAHYLASLTPIKIIKKAPVNK